MFGGYLGFVKAVDEIINHLLLHYVLAGVGLAAIIFLWVVLWLDEIAVF